MPDHAPVTEATRREFKAWFSELLPKRCDFCECPAVRWFFDGAVTAQCEQHGKRFANA